MSTGFALCSECGVMREIRVVFLHNEGKAVERFAHHVGPKGIRCPNSEKDIPVAGPVLRYDPDADALAPPTPVKRMSGLGEWLIEIEIEPGIKYIQVSHSVCDGAWVYKDEITVQDVLVDIHKHECQPDMVAKVEKANATATRRSRFSTSPGYSPTIYSHGSGSV